MCHTSYVSFFCKGDKPTPEAAKKKKNQTEVHIFCKVIITFWLWCLVTGDTNALLHHYHAAQLYVTLSYTASRQEQQLYI